MASGAKTAYLNRKDGDWGQDTAEKLRKRKVKVVGEGWLWFPPWGAG